ncbi:hypothetical protein PV327_002244 [Microctonus hyperodae]|uniref:Ig-like domain-containing protein n=1 Tax=Microctonus hyperodae TaxID=165561 RepID=A0AA39KNW9_MICHY|nr:hypothetical protein PV327_002244 [Microctonus hyperodae]
MNTKRVIGMPKPLDLESPRNRNGTTNHNSNISSTTRFDNVHDPEITHVLADAGQNVTLECPGVSERSVISRLVWRANDNRIVEYGSQSTTYFVHHNRIILSERNFTLFFRPVQSEDSGEYQCIVNSRNIPEVIVNLTVQGK